MGEFLRRLLEPDFMPHGYCWKWEPWVVWTHVVADSTIFLAYMFIGITLLRIAARRRDVAANLVLVLFGAFIVSCGCTHAMEVFNTWNGVFRLSGLIKVITAAVSLVAAVPLVRILPKLLAAPALTQVLEMDAALSSEQQEKQRVEGQLRETQDRYRQLVEGIRDYAIFMMDPAGRITSWNPGAERITGYSAGEVLGQSFARLFPEEEAAAGRPAAILLAAAASGRLEDEGWRIRKDGSRFLASGIITPFRDGQGTLAGFSKVTRDITEQRATQAALQHLAESLEDQVKAQLQELRESEARLQGFIRHSPAAIAFKGLDGRYLLINPRTATLVGRPGPEILGRTDEELVPAELRAWHRELDERVLHGRQELQVEQHWVRADGAAFDLIVDRFPLVDATGQCWGLGLFATDITERKQADRALLQSQKLESLGVLAGGIAHDFNNLLGAMQGNVELAMTEVSLERAQPFLQTLKGLMAKASGLLGQMLAYAGRGKASLSRLDLNEVVEEMTRLLGTAISTRARIRLDLQPDLPAMAADPSQIHQVVMNLVLNASEAISGPQGVITITTRRQLVSRTLIDAVYPGQSLRPGPHVVLEVEDNGSGMRPDVLKKIFDPFFTTKFTGRGLGLAAIHGIVRSHQGAIRVYSEPGKGSTFRVLFPVEPGSLEPEAAETPAAPAAGPDPAGGLVLVVDDEDEVRAVAVAALERAGLATLQARDGLEALRRFEQHRDRIRLILLDLTMPNLDGEGAYRQIRRRDPRVPVILTSGFNQAEVLGRFQGGGLSGFLKKPFELGPLVELVRKAMR